MIPLPAPVGAEEAERGSSGLVTAAAGCVSLGDAVAHPAGDADLGLSSGLSPAAQGCRWSALEPSPAAPQ